MRTAEDTLHSSIFALQAHVTVLKIGKIPHYVQKNPKPKPGSWIYKVRAYPPLPKTAENPTHATG